VSSRTRILIVRSCRLSQFLAAVVYARQQNPAAEIVALSHRGHRQVLRAAGVDRVIEVPGRRFGLLATPPWTLAQLRAENFQQIVVPQMNDDADAHANLYRVVMAFNAPNVVILPGEGRRPQAFDRPAFVSHVLQHSYAGGGFSRWDAAMLVGVAYLTRLR
jgi:hypothetical protein